MCRNKLKALFTTGKLFCPQSELNLKYSLNGGQSFRWKETSEGNWIGVFARKVWILSRDKDYIVYKVFNDDTYSLPEKRSPEISVEDSEVYEKLLIDYFRLDVPLKDLYKEWSKADANFAEISETFYGIRILKQDPVENIFSFICSSNNFISRISEMVEKLCTFYGKKISEVDGQEYYSFPSVEALSKPGVFEKLRDSSFGYRAKYINESAVKIVRQGGNSWVEKLQDMSYSDAKNELMKLTGIGAKVADCICLMSLGHFEAVPVDTHVFQIASQYYLPHLKSAKSVTPKINNEIGDHFRSLYGNMAGWAHTILFCNRLKRFQTSTPSVKRNASTTSEKIAKKKKKK